MQYDTEIKGRVIIHYLGTELHFNSSGLPSVCNGFLTVLNIW